MSDIIPEWALKKLLAQDPDFNKIPPALYDMWRKPGSESDYEEFVSHAKEIWGNLSGNDDQKKKSTNNKDEATKEEIAAVMKQIM
jgi:hypothetical protein